MSRQRKITIAVVAALVVAALGLFLAPEKSAFKSSAIFVRDSYSKESHVEIDAQVDRNLISKYDQVSLQINIRNNNTEPITDLRVSISAPGFEWASSDLVRQIPPSVSADSVVTVSMPFKAMANSGSYDIVVFFSWNKKSRYTSAISVGPLKMAGLFGQDRANRFLSRGSQLIKDLTLPIVLALLGYYFQLLQSRVERQRRDEEKARDERQQVRQNILPLVMSLSERHYMPIVRASRLLIIDYQNSLSSSEKSLDKVFFDTLFLLKRMDYLRRDKGQIFFQDSAAEAIASDVWLILREKLLAVLGDSQVGLALKKIQVEDGFAEFSAKRYQLLLNTSFLEFRKWASSEPEEFGRYLRLIDLLQAVFRFESNRPFAEHWYGCKKGLEFETDFAAKLELPRSPLSKSAQTRIETLTKDWPAYFASANST